MAIAGGLDRLDCKLLAELDASSRDSLSQISKKIRLGSDLVHYRFERLREREIILRSSAIIDFYRTGQTLFKVYLRLQNQPERYKAIEKHLNRSLELHWFARTHGSWDLIFSFYAENPKAAYEKLTSALEPYSTTIQQTAVLTVVSRIRFSGSFGIKRQRMKTVIGEEPDVISLEPIELALLKALENDARTPVTSLAVKLKTTPAVIDYRRKKLEQQGIINGYRLHINQRALGLALYKLCLKLRSHNPKVLQAIEDFCRDSEYGVCVIHQLGEWLTELEVEVQSYQQLHEIVDALRTLLGDALQAIDPLLVRDCYYLNRSE